MAKTAKKKVGRPSKYANPRLTLTFRLQQDRYEAIKAEAEKNGRSISEEIERRLDRISEWEKSFESAHRLLRDAETVSAVRLRSTLRDNGFQPVSTMRGIVWLEPGLNPYEVAIWTEPTAFQKAQEDAMRNVFREIVRQEKGDAP